MTEFKILDTDCWICGNVNDITYHHTLPQHWKPKKNVVVPICKKCHNRLNAEDLAGMLSFATRLEHELGRQVSMWGSARINIEKYTQGQQLLLDAFKKKENSSTIAKNPSEPHEGNPSNVSHKSQEGEKN